MPGPSISTYAYPWDLLDIGVDDVFAELAGVGISAIDLASSYHSIATFSPRAGAKRLMYQEHGAVYFPARAGRYGRIRPNVWPDNEVVGAWPTAADAARRHGIELRAWTIGMFQPWIAHAYPDCARTLATGATVPSGVCPASADVQEYVAALAADSVDQFGLSGVQLEGIGFPAYDYGWVRPRVLLDIGPWTQWLLSLCFCRNCVSKAEHAGIHIPALRERVVSEIRRGFDASGDSDPTPDRDEQHRQWLASSEDYAEFIRLRGESVVTLVATIAQAVRTAAPAAKIGIHDMDDVDLRAASPHIDAIILADTTPHPLRPVVHESEDDARRARQLATDANLRLDYLLNLTPKSAPSSAETERKLRHFIALPVDQVGIYNFGLLRKSQIEYVADKIRHLSS